ncbi:MAG: DHH family phosphoesterase [bacterium]|nr:DHH family phosphoesterase [bacterium]
MTEVEQINQIISDSQKIIIIQADNPDADSLASSLALESIFHELGKDPVMYCGIDMPEYLKYLSGWDRVEKQIPNQFDASVIVDTSTLTLLEKLSESGSMGWVASKPVIVLDHHANTDNPIEFSSLTLNDPTKVSTGELIFDIAKSLNWPLSITSCSHIMTSILADSMGLTTETTSAATYRVMAELVETGVSRPELEELRRAYNKMPLAIFNYKAKLIERTEFFEDGKLAMITVPQQEINDYSPLYNPAPLIQSEHLQTENVLISIVLKNYDSGRITAAIRCNQGAPIAGKLAGYFGGGGHDYAAGFKLEGKQLDNVKSECKKIISQLLGDTAGEV